MSAKIIPLLPLLPLHSSFPNTWQESARFDAFCPTCNDSRAQFGYSSRALSRLLTRGGPIEAHCVTCDGLWNITADERFRLATRLQLSCS